MSFPLRRPILWRQLFNLPAVLALSDDCTGGEAVSTIFCLGALRSLAESADVAAKRDDLARAIQRLNAVGLTERGANRSVIERADDPLRSALVYPVGRP
jgi:hypothetical protein